MKSRPATYRRSTFALLTCGPILAATILLADNARAAQIRPVVQAELLDVSADQPLWYEGSLVRLGGGARFGEHLGVTADATLLSGTVNMFWPLVPTATVFWDFDPHRTWQRRQAYFKASWRHTSESVDDMDFWEGVKLSLGANYTWYVLTPHIDADLIMPDHYGRRLGGTLGITIGGTYVILPRAESGND